MNIRRKFIKLFSDGLVKSVGHKIMVPYLLTGGNDWDTGMFFAQFALESLPEELLSEDDYVSLSEGASGLSFEAEDFLDTMDSTQKSEIALRVAKELFENDLNMALPIDVGVEVSDVCLYVNSLGPFIEVTLDDESYDALNRFCEENGFGEEWKNSVKGDLRRGDMWGTRIVPLTDDEWKLLFAVWNGENRA